MDATSPPRRQVLGERVAMRWKALPHEDGLLLLTLKYYYEDLPDRGWVGRLRWIVLISSSTNRYP